jgi:FkbM family methyltransferase
MKQALNKFLLNPIAQFLGIARYKTVRPRKLPEAQYDSLAALKCRIWYNQYGGYCLPESSLHRTAARKILRGMVYEPETIEFMRDHCAGGDIVHAGTYFGDFLPGLSQACPSGFRIWAFEPNTESYRCAQITMAINALENVTLQNAGLGESAAILRLRTLDENGVSLGGKSRMVSVEEFNALTDQEVEIMAIDDTIESGRPVSIVQLDVEGHEQAALSGALRTIRRCLPILILEIQRGSDLLERPWFKDNILSLGYVQTRSLHGNTVFQCP